MTTTYHTAIATGESNAPSTINTRLAALDAAIAARAAEITSLNTSGVGSVYAQINNGSGEADTSWAIDNISGTFLAGATVVYTVSGIVYSSTVAANASSSPLTVTTAPGVTIPDNTVISQVPAGIAGKMLESVRNVVDPTYGADATGSTDSRTAINSAISAAAAGETVLFPKGTYDLGTGDVTIPDGVILRGDGATISVDSGRRCFNIGSNVQIHGLKFDGNDDASANTTSRFFQIQDKTNILITDCEFNDMGNRPISIGGGSNIWIVNCRFTNIRQENGSCGISISANDADTAGSTNIVVRNCSFINPDIDDDGAAGLIIAGDNVNDLQISGVLVDGCYFKHMGRGYTEDGPRGDVDVYNDVEHIKIANCISINSALGLTKYDDVYDGMVIGCTIINPAAHGLTFSHRYGNTLPRSCVFANNYIYGAGVNGIFIDGGADSAPANYCNDLVVANNVIDYSGRSGIRCEEAANLVIAGNVIKRTNRDTVNFSDGYGIILNNSTVISTPVPVTITGNVVDMDDQGITAIFVDSGDETASPGATVISNNSIANTASNGILIRDTEAAKLFGNSFSNVTTEVTTGSLTSIIIDGYSEDVRTIASDAITVTSAPRSLVVIDTEGAAATDDLATINGGRSGQIVTLMTQNDGRDVTIKDGTDNIQLAGGDFTLDRIYDTLTLIKSGAGWREIARSNNV